MFNPKRALENPILSPVSENDWEREGAFNGSVAKRGRKVYLLYRALSSARDWQEANLRLSSIGCGVSSDGIHFKKRYQLITPEYDWENFGCEDPRVTKFGNKYFIFYTALSLYPFRAEGIKIGLALTHDFKKIDAKRLVTTFNSKAMALFPEKIKGKLGAILTVDTDRPPAKIAIATFKNEKQIWSQKYWDKWYGSLEEHIVPLLRSPADQVEVGAPPLKTKYGWLLLYCYIKNYLSSPRIFGVEAALLDFHDPKKLLGRTSEPILVPEEDYELQGNTPNVVFPSGAMIKGDKLLLYYGAADTHCALAQYSLKDLLKNHIIRKFPKKIELESEKKDKGKLKRYLANPIIAPRPEFSWERKATFNPAALELEGKIHLVYRAMSLDNTSVMGYAASSDGFHIEERLPLPIYGPRESFEQKTRPGNSGTEDPRLTKIGNKLYMLYTAFDGTNPPRIALTSIRVKDFLKRRWSWKKPILISPPGIADKDGCLFSKKIKGKYLILHRFGDCICVDFLKDLKFKNNRWLEHEMSLIKPRPDKWDNRKVGVAAPPIETKEGWLLLYHGVSEPGTIYKVGAALLELDNPTQVIAKTDCPILEPETSYEKQGQVPNVVFPCGAIILKGRLLVYYGGADKVVGVAAIGLNKILKKLEAA